MSDVVGYELFLLRKGLRPSTVGLRVQCLKIVRKALPDLTPTAFDTFLISMYKAGSNPSYLNNLILAVKDYGDFLQIDDYKNTAKFHATETFKGTLSDQEIRDFLALPKPANSRGNSYEKMTMFFKIMAHTGMRGSEIAKLSINDINHGMGVIELDKTKTTPRLVPLPPGLLEEIRLYCITLTSEELFPNMLHDARRLHFMSRLKRLGIKRKKITPHSLRYSYITRMLGEDINLMKVQRIVGHKQVSTTAKYYKYVTKDIIEAARKDPLVRDTLSFADRFKQVRDIFRKVLDDFALTPKEERMMKKLLLENL